MSEDAIAVEKEPIELATLLRATNGLRQALEMVGVDSGSIQVTLEQDEWIRLAAFAEATFKDCMLPADQLQIRSFSEGEITIGGITFSSQQTLLEQLEKEANPPHFIVFDEAAAIPDETWLTITPGALQWCEMNVVCDPAMPPDSARLLYAPAAKPGEKPVSMGGVSSGHGCGGGGGGGTYQNDVIHCAGAAGGAAGGRKATSAWEEMVKGMARKHTDRQRVKSLIGCLLGTHMPSEESMEKAIADLAAYGQAKLSFNDYSQSFEYADKLDPAFEVTHRVFDNGDQLIIGGPKKSASARAQEMLAMQHAIDMIAKTNPEKIMQMIPGVAKFDMEKTKEILDGNSDAADKKPYADAFDIAKAMIEGERKAK